ncbi:motility associated factor glycosyltransferase family protein [Moorella sulfitireducens]|uniref:motility associated factor glycosyltransferase family protein n=1 Tax=Neomoorella sulfitireducens TaxID=2972948 RepID=UPI0021ACC2F9|nr:6-hydroxymethylpterin diphosphokinase MptE-like protein [Moorella sulfitireducens]
MTLRYGNKWLHSSYDPLNEGKRWAAEVSYQPGDTLIVLGVGLGYHLAALVEKANEVKIIAVEPAVELLKYCFFNPALKNLEQTGKIIIFHHEQPLQNFLTAHIDQFLLERVKVIEYKPLERVFPQEFLKYRREINDILFGLLCSLNTALRFSVTWTRNFFLNLAKVLTSTPVKSFYGVFQSKPGIIVSAGPSLNKNLSLLKEAKGKAIILTVGTALKPVLATGINPDIGVSIDGGKANFRHFEGIDTTGFPLLFDPIIYPRILEEYKGCLIASVYFEIFQTWLQNLGYLDPGQVRMGPSVANYAFDFALKLGLDPIIFIGQDLAFTGGNTHARGTVYENREPTKEKSRLLEIEGFYGGKVITDRSLHAMLQYIETQIAMTANGRRIINATEGGARIKGTEVMTLRQAIDTYCQEPFNPDTRIKEICSSYQPLNKIKPGELAEKIKAEKAVMEKAIKICRTGERLARDLELAFTSKMPSQQQVNKILKRLDKVDAEINNLREELLPVAMVFQPVWFQLNKGPFSRPEAEWRAEGLRLAKKSLLLYQGLAEGIDIVQDAMAQAAERLSSV